jgi:phosphatidylglycerophosphate synthase
MTFQEIRKCEDPHGIYSRFVCYIASIIAFCFDKIKLGITPNQITFLNLISVVGFIYFFLIAKDFVLAVILINVSLILDNLDGIWARYKNKKTKFGGIFDPFIDRINSILIFTALGLYAYVIFMNDIFLLLIGIVFMLSHIAIEFKPYLEKAGVVPLKLESKKMSIPSTIIFELFAGDKFYVLLTLVLLFEPTALGFLALFGYEILRRMLWVGKLCFTLTKFYMKGE